MNPTPLCPPPSVDQGGFTSYLVIVLTPVDFVLFPGFISESLRGTCGGGGLEVMCVGRGGRQLECYYHFGSGPSGSSEERVGRRVVDSKGTIHLGTRILTP